MYTYVHVCIKADIASSIICLRCTLAGIGGGRDIKGRFSERAFLHEVGRFHAVYLCKLELE